MHVFLTFSLFYDKSSVWLCFILIYYNWSFLREKIFFSLNRKNVGLVLKDKQNFSIIHHQLPHSHPGFPSRLNVLFLEKVTRSTCEDTFPAVLDIKSTKIGRRKLNNVTILNILNNSLSLNCFAQSKTLQLLAACLALTSAKKRKQTES